MQALPQTLSRDVLVVDDDPGIRETITAVLEDEGYSVAAAANGAEALDTLEGGVRPRVILLDLRMPILDGVRFREIQRKRPGLADIPIVVLSGDRDACTVAGPMHADRCILKPVELEELLQVVSRYR